MKPYWRLNPIDFEALKELLPEAAKWADTVELETVRIYAGWDVPRGYFSIENGDRPRFYKFAVAIRDHGETDAEAASLISRIPGQNESPKAKP